MQNTLTSDSDAEVSAPRSKTPQRKTLELLRVFSKKGRRQTRPRSASESDPCKIKTSTWMRRSKHLPSEKGIDSLRRLAITTGTTRGNARKEQAAQLSIGKGKGKGKATAAEARRHSSASGLNAELNRKCKRPRAFPSSFEASSLIGRTPRTPSSVPSFPIYFTDVTGISTWASRIIKDSPFDADAEIDATPYSVSRPQTKPVATQTTYSLHGSADFCSSKDVLPIRLLPRGLPCQEAVVLLSDRSEFSLPALVNLFVHITSP
ncbi:hypothetical protein DXG01_007808 [Tephrocybe rancida]|nr:hypothetical protein DXG01_007808 [Tephrocybe rancida]